MVGFPGGRGGAAGRLAIDSLRAAKGRTSPGPDDITKRGHLEWDPRGTFPHG